MLLRIERLELFDEFEEWYMMQVSPFDICYEKCLNSVLYTLLGVRGSVSLFLLFCNQLVKMKSKIEIYDLSIARFNASNWWHDQNQLHALLIDNEELLFCLFHYQHINFFIRVIEFQEHYCVAYAINDAMVWSLSLLFVMYLSLFSVWEGHRMENCLIQSANKLATGILLLHLSWIEIWGPNYF